MYSTQAIPEWPVFSTFLLLLCFGGLGGASFAFAAPDLRPTQFQVPAIATRAYAGQQVTASIRVWNAGTKDAAAFKISVYYTDNTPSGITTKLVEQAHPGLKAGFYGSPLSLSFKLPGSLLFGSNRRLYLEVDSGKSVTESNETNNRYVTSFKVTSPPDFRFLSFQSSNSSPRPGETISVTYELQNNWGSRAENVEVELYFSRFSNLGNNPSKVLLNTTTIARLDALASYKASLQVTLPKSTLAGTNYLILWVDRKNTVKEYNERDNLKGISITMQKGLSDLQVAKVSFSNAGIGAQTPIPISLSIKNTGANRETNVRVRVLYGDSTSTTKLTSMGDVVFNVVDPGTTSSVLKGYFRLKNNVTVGPKVLHVVVDPDNKIQESNETNNRLTTPFHVTQKPDLKWLSFGSSNLLPTAGTKISLRYNLFNASGSRAEKVSYAFYLSSTTTRNSNAILLKRMSVTGVDVLQSWTDRDSKAEVTLPATASGVMYLLAVADDGNTLAESNENNNLSYARLTIRGNSTVDLQLNSIRVTGSPLQAGSRLKLQWTVQNKGTGAAGAFVVHVYYGDSSTPTNLTLLGKTTLSGLAANSMTPLQTTQVSLPSLVLNGKRYLHIHVDAANQVVESNEQNNKSTQALFVTGLPDLYATTFQSSVTTARPGQVVTLRFRIINQGKARTPTSFRIRIYESDKMVTTPQSTIIATLNIPSLQAGASYPAAGTQAVQATVPTGLTGSGRRYWLFFLDHGNAIRESDESNNLSTPFYLLQTPTPEPGSEPPVEPSREPQADAGIPDTGQEPNPPDARPTDKQTGCLDNTDCGTGTFCKEGVCRKVCTCTPCPSGETCVHGVCTKNPCLTVRCAKGTTCIVATGACVPKPCAGFQCPRGTACQQGQCVPNSCPSREMQEEPNRDAKSEGPFEGTNEPDLSDASDALEPTVKEPAPDAGVQDTNPLDHSSPDAFEPLPDNAVKEPNTQEKDHEHSVQESFVGEGGEPQGCQCRTATPTPFSGVLVFFVVLLLLCRRRNS